MQLFLAVILVHGGDEHAAGVLAHHLAVGQVEDRNDGLADELLRLVELVDASMSDDFDMVAMETVNNQYLGGDTSLACSADTQAEIDRQVVALIKKQHDKAIKILTDNRDKLDELAKFLYEKETITGEEFMEMLNK